MKKLKVIIFGSTGMVGEGVLHESLNHPRVQSVLVVNRRPCGKTHEKLREIIHSDFHDFSAIRDQLDGYDAAYFCMGVSSMGMKEEAYRRVTYDLTMHVARILKEENPHLVFNYVSGDGTDSSEQGRLMWARVKGKTENDLLALFERAYMFRPGYIQPIKGLKNSYKIYRFVGPFYPIWKRLFPRFVCTLEDLGLAMIHVSLNPVGERIIGNPEIRALAQSERGQLKQ